MSIPMPPKLQKMRDITTNQSNDSDRITSYNMGFNHCWEIIGPVLMDAKKELEVIAQYELGEEYIVEEALNKINSLLEV